MSADFIDSNVFVYLFDEQADTKRERAQRIVHGALREGKAFISYQVVQETLNVITRKLRPAASAEDAGRLMTRVLVPLWRVMPSETLFQRGIELKARCGFSFYDAMIVAAALAAGCTRLISEDLQHGQRIDTLTIENPFR